MHKKNNEKCPYNPLKRKIHVSGFVMFQVGPNDALSQNFMKLGLLVAPENVNTHTHTDRHTDMLYTQDSCFINIDIICLAVIN